MDDQELKKKKDGSIFGMSPEEVRKYLQDLVKRLPWMKDILEGLEKVPKDYPEFPEHKRMEE